MVPACVALVRKTCLSAYSAWTFFRALSRALLLVALVTASLFAAWVGGAWTPQTRYEHGWQRDWVNLWGGKVKRFWRSRLNCEVIHDCSDAEHWAMEPQECTPDTECWTGAFLWWCFPCVVTLTLLVASIVCAILWRVLQQSKRAAHTQAPTEAQPSARPRTATRGVPARAPSAASTRSAPPLPQAAVKLFAWSILLFTSGVWVSTSIAATSLNMTRVIVMALLLFLVVTGSLVGSTLGWSQIRKSAGNLKVTQKIRVLSEGVKDYGRGLFCLAFAPLVLGYFLLSLLNQAARHCLPCTQSAQGGRLLTESAHKQLALLKAWNWGSICSKVTFWGVFYMVMQVLVSKVVFLFFSWFNEQLADTAPIAVCAIFFVVGVIMFTIPVVPGVPVYVTAGIIIPASFMHEASPGWQAADEVPGSFWLGLLVACCVVFCVKLAAVYVEQEGIGRFLGRRVSVRAFCNVNAIEMKATKCLLQTPGLNVAKCTILVGGPDWPTSVITGILRLSPTQMLIGTLPIVLLVVPSTAAGGFLLVKAQSETFASLSTVVTMFAMSTQLAAFLGACWAIDKYATDHRDELQAVPDDEEVARLDRANLAQSIAWRIVTRWDTPGQPRWPHTTIMVAALVLTGTMFLNGFVTCWRDFEISNTIDGDLDGNVLNIVLRPGYVVIAGFALGWLLRYVFLRWAEAAAKRYVEEHPEVRLMRAAPVPGVTRRTADVTDLSPAGEEARKTKP